MKNNTTDMNVSSFNDDPLLTAYALGELSGDEAESIEQRISEQPSLRSEVESIRAMAAMLRCEFASEPAEALTFAQRAAVIDHASPASRATSQRDRSVLAKPQFSRSRWIGSGLAAAAMIALAATAAMIYFTGRADGPSFATQSGALEQSEMSRGVPSPRAGARVAAGEDAARSEMTEAMVVDPAVRDAIELATTDKAAHELGGEREIEAFHLRADSTLMQPAPSSTPSPGQPVTGGDSAPSRGVGGGGAAPDANGAAAASRAGSTGLAQETLAERPRQRSTDAPADTPSDERVNEAPQSALPPSPPPPPPPSASESQNAPQRSSETKPDAPATPKQEQLHDRDDQAESTRGGLRGPVREQPVTTTAAPRFEDQEIDAMEEPEVRRAISESEQYQQLNAVDSRTQAHLRKQTERLKTRLRLLERAEAEEYSRIHDNPFIRPVGEDALSTFALDVDTASYSNIRRFLSEGRLPPADAVRIEEMINYFKYDYPPPSAADGTEVPPFSANLELGLPPWNPEHRLLRVGLRGKDVRMDMRPATSLVFLVDVSGSMNEPNKLPLVKASLNLLVQQLNGDDRLAIVTYAGNAGLVLDSCFVNADNRVQIDAAIENMTPGGSTNGSGGINLAYDVARQHFIRGGVNRVILCTDGDFNVGVSGDDALVQLIEDQRDSGVFLTVLGFGRGNFKDAKMERLTNAGNGNFAYIDSVDEARKVLVEQAGGTLVTIAKDVKFQVEFNPAKVGAYRLIGYENRLLAAEDFNNDLKDAGEIGSGHTMTALYEIVPVGAAAAALAKNQPQGEIDELKYQKPAAATAPEMASDELLEVKIRFKEPDGDTSSLLRFPLSDDIENDALPSNDFRFAAAVAEFGMLLRRSQFVSGGTYDHVIAEAEGSMGEDAEGYRAEFIELVKKARALDVVE